MPDPRAAAPELLDLRKSDAPIPQFVNAMKMAGIEIEPEEVANNLQYQPLTGADGKQYVIATFNLDPDPNQQGENLEGSIALLIWGEEGGWKKATLGNYWFALGKRVGVYMDGGEYNFPNNIHLLNQYFGEGGVIALNGQVRPNANRPPSNANRIAQNAQINDLALFFHYVVEPGKFPDDVNSSNVDSWLDSRFTGIIQVLKNNKAAGQPMYVSFNEAWEGNEWNEEKNPLRDKYGNKWVEEYTYLLLSKFLNEGLVPNKDFVIVFNDANLFNNPTKQNIVYNTLQQAREKAFNRLIADPQIKNRLDELGITSANDVNILLGVESGIKLGQTVDSRQYQAEPTQGQITALASKFSNLGGILITELNPVGDENQKVKFLTMLFNLLKTDSNLKGVLFWNLFLPDDSEDYSTFDRLILFDDKGNPTSLYFILLK